MNIRSLIAAPIAILLAVLSLAAVRSNTDLTRPLLAAPLALRPGLSISTLPARQVRPSAAEIRAAAMLSEPAMANRDEAYHTGGSRRAAAPSLALASSLNPSMPYYAFAPHLLTAKD